jgi:hypothetical protein
MDTGYTNHITSTLFYFIDIQYDNFSIYNNINGLIKFESIRIIQILIQESDSKPIICTIFMKEWNVYAG